MRRILQVSPLPGFEPEIGRWLGAMEEVRSATLATVADLNPSVLDWAGPGDDENSIGSLLYHIALIEMDWLFLDILEREPPPVVLEDFPHHVVEESGRLARVAGIPLADHIGRLARSRACFLAAMRGMSIDDWRRSRTPAGVDYSVTPEWAVFHLIEHEAGHLYQIRALLHRSRRAAEVGS